MGCGKASTVVISGTTKETSSGKKVAGKRTGHSIRQSTAKIAKTVVNERGIGLRPDSGEVKDVKLLKENRAEFEKNLERVENEKVDQKLAEHEVFDQQIYRILQKGNG